MLTDPAIRPREITIRGIVIGILLTLIFTAANVYLGLKVALVFGTSIPAAVVSMAALSFVKGSSILENNIVQTIASAAGAMAAIIFVLPALLIIGWWTHIPFWISFLICASGGVLGVVFAIPLRRVMVVQSDLPYPESLAAASLLEVGSKAHKDSSAAAREGLAALLYGATGSALLSLVTATRAAAGEAMGFFRLGRSITGYHISFSMALLGAGYLVGLSVGLAIFVGVLIAWAGALPILTAMSPSGGATLHDFALSVWLHQVRFIGAGCMAVAALWALAKLAVPVGRGAISAFAVTSSAKNVTDTTDVDLSPFWIVILSVVCFAAIGCLFLTFLSGTPLYSNSAELIWTALTVVLVVGSAVATVGGYMAGLIGTSNSPVSGVGILTVLICATLFVTVLQPEDGTRKALVAFALFATAVVFAIGISANNNLQVMKIGQLLGAKPQAQQWALIIGMVVGSLAIPPVVSLLNDTRGFVGAIQPVSAHGAPLAAPQANLMASLAQAVIAQHPDWQMIGIGALIGAIVIAIDTLLGFKRWVRLPPLCVGMGMYLPMATTMPVVLGAVLGHLYKRYWASRTLDPDHAQRLGVLVASGMIVGESLFGVLLAGLVVIFNNDAPLALLPVKFGPAPMLGWIIFVVLISELYGWKIRHSRTIKPASANNISP